MNIRVICGPGLNAFVLRSFPQGQWGRSFHRVKVVAAVIHGKNGTKKIALMCCGQTMTREYFEKRMENNRLKCIGSGNTVIMDKSRFHRKKTLQAICERAGVDLLFLPPYSPDYNPIEKDWANMKRELCDTAPLYPVVAGQKHFLNF